MQRLLVHRTIPLSSLTSGSLRTLAEQVKFAKRTRDPQESLRIAEERYDALLNYGNREMPTSDKIPVWNPGELVQAVSKPVDLRKILDSFLPKQNLQTEHWHKTPGYGGSGKVYHSVACPADYDPPYWEDIQQHIAGTEYRINTAGHRVVQAHVKLPLDVGGFEWTWCGLEGIKSGGFIPMIKEALTLIPYSETSILGWDVMHDGERPWVLEINTAPGLNEATASRIAEVMNDKS